MRHFKKGSPLKALRHRKSVLLFTLVGLTLVISAVAVFRHSFLSKYSEPVRIVVAGDGRAEYPWNPPRVEDKDGINKVITLEITEAVFKEDAQILLWTGDCTNVSDNNPDTLRKQLRAWRDILQPLYDNKITVLPVRGNHEVYRYDKGSYEPIPILDAKENWNEVFSGEYALPTNGPENEKNLSFYYVRDSVLCVGLDQYSNPSGHFVDQSWLEQVLKNYKRPFVFVYAHEPAFMSGSHTVNDTLGANPVARNALWESLIRAGARVYVCGHDHLYDHMAVVRASGDPGPVMHQLTAGTAGAPFYYGGTYKDNDLAWELNRRQHIENTYGYILIAIEKNKATITFKGRISPGHYEPMDTLSYTAAIR
jgi:hypothetical protein